MSRAADSRGWNGQVRVVAGLSALICLPLVIAVIALSRIHWSPVLDLAMTELRVRDVGSRHTPLIGLPGRIGVFPNQGSHPGPLSFYLLAPIYRIFGSGAWSLELGSALIHIAAVVAGLALAVRRGGTRLGIVFAALFAVVLRGYGAGVLTQPWNPYLPVIAWLVVLLAAWSILEGDAPALVVFVAFGSLCAQTHVPYVALVAGLGTSVGLWALVRNRLNGKSGELGTAARSAVSNPMFQRVEMPGARRWSLISLAVGIVVWLPPVADQVRRSPGNLSMLKDHFGSPPEADIGLAAGLKHLLRHLDLSRLLGHAFTESNYFLTTSLALDGSVVPGVLLVVVWIAAAVVAWRLRHRALIHLHLVVAIAFVLAFVATTRIFGKLWFYLTFWAWGLLALCLLAVAWTCVAALHRYRAADPRVMQVAMISAVVLAVVSTASFSWSAAGATTPERYLSDTLTAVVGPTADAIEAGIGAADGRDGVYVVTWTDAAYFGSQGYGLINELERRGFDVGASSTFRVPVTQQRVIDPALATAGIHLATGRYIADWRAVPGVEEVAFVEPRDAAQVALYDDLHRQVEDDLLRLGLADLVEFLDTNLFTVRLDPRVPADVQEVVNEMLQLGQPTAVFIVPPLTPWPAAPPTDASQ